MREVQRPEASGKGKPRAFDGPGGLRWWPVNPPLVGFVCQARPFKLQAMQNDAGIVVLTLRRGAARLKREDLPDFPTTLRRAARLLHDARSLLPRPIDTVRRKGEQEAGRP